MTTRLSRRQLNRATLARQLLLSRTNTSTVAAVRQVCGLQAQEARPPFVGLWSRVAGFDDTRLHAALHNREVVRATLMRGTLHLVEAGDYAAFRAPLRAMLEQGIRVLGARAKGLDMAAVLPVARDLLTERPRTFTETREALRAHFPDVNERALGYAVRTHLPLVMVPTPDRWGFPAVARFALAEQWLGSPLPDDPAPEPLALRYLAAFGPATAIDLQAWSGLTGMRSVLTGLRPSLRVFRDEVGRELFDLPDAPRPDPDVVAEPRFLPEFDSLMLAHSDRTRVMAEQYRARLVTKNLRVRAAVLVDGFVCGTWLVRRTARTATLHVSPFEELPAGVRDQLGVEGTDLLRFTEPAAATPDVVIEAPVP